VNDPWEDPGPDGGRTPQHDDDAERCVLGGMMLSAAAIDDVLDVPLAAADFYKPAHAAIFDAVVELHRRGDPVDAMTVKAALDRTGQLAHAGGAGYLLTLIHGVPTAANSGYYAETVQAKAELRRLGEAGTRIVQMSHSTDASDVRAIVDRAAAEIQGVVRTAKADGDVTAVADEAEAFLSALLDGGPPRAYLPVPYADLQEAAPIEDGDLVVVAGATGMGKSVVMVDFARSAAIRHAKRTLLVSMEMSKDQLMQRIFAAEAKVRLHALRGAEPLTEDERTRLGTAFGQLCDAPLHFLARGTVTTTHLRSMLRRAQARHQLPELVVVDYLQILTVERPTANRTADVSTLSRELKQIAMDFGVPIVVGSQLNRQVSGRSDKRPVLSDLKESGSIEQDANIVVLLHRDDYYDREAKRAGQLDLIVAKNRQGKTSTVTVAFQGHYSRCMDMAWSPSDALRGMQ
jgi:replicative DNA helicase